MISLAGGLLIAYVLGSIPTGYWMGKVFFQKDIRKVGSGNVGATNTFRALGPFPGILALFFDIGKGYASVCWIPVWMGFETGPVMQISLGCAAIAGHTWTLFLKFKGGKGVATSAGVFLALSWVGIVTTLMIFVFVLLISKYISLASLASAVCMPIVLWIYKEPKEIVGFSVMIAMLIIIRHKDNITRLIKGQEHCISMRSQGKS